MGNIFIMEYFQFTYWNDIPGESLVTFDRTCTFWELINALTAHLKSIPHEYHEGEMCSLYDMLDYLDMYVPGIQPNENIPRFRWIYCWVTEGSSEGHYFHIECTTPDNETVPLLIAKTLSGNTELALLINTEFNRFILNHRL